MLFILNFARQNCRILKTVHFCSKSVFNSSCLWIYCLKLVLLFCFVSVFILDQSLTKMPQEFYVLKCFSCETFQVQIVKKAKKWECKMCGAKQSLKRNYGKGSSKDCRIQVMKLNELRLSKCSSLDQMEDEIPEETWSDDLIGQPVREETKEHKPSVSKWAEYVEENLPDTDTETDDNVENFLFEFVERKKKRMKKMPESCYSKNKKICRKSCGSELFSKGDETVELGSPPKNEEVSFSEIKHNADNKDFIQFNNKFSSGKYAKYLHDEEVNSDLIQKVNKTSNIFESSLTDLDDVLNF